MLKDWSIILMGTPLMTPAGAAEEGLAYVFKARDVEEEPSDFEQRALSRSCTDIQEVSCSLIMRQSSDILGLTPTFAAKSCYLKYTSSCHTPQK